MWFSFLFCSRFSYDLRKQIVSNLKSNTEEKSKKIDVKSELKKYKEMLEEGLITQEQYDAKSNKLLDL